MILCFDIDNVICRTQGSNYKKSIPKKKVIRKINELYNKGHYIKLFTARYMGRSRDKVSVAKKKGYILTKKQLKKWNINYHKLIFGKPSYDLFIDDKAIFYNNNWIKKINKYLKFKK